MTENNLMQVLFLLRSKLDAQQMFLVQQRLTRTSDLAVGELGALAFKQTWICLLLSVFIGNFGADRFYVKSYGIAIAKLAIGVAIFIMNIVFLVFVNMLYTESGMFLPVNSLNITESGMVTFSIIITVAELGYLVYRIYDAFLCIKQCRVYNMNLVIAVLDKYENSAGNSFGGDVFGELNNNDVFSELNTGSSNIFEELD